MGAAEDLRRDLERSASDDGAPWFACARCERSDGFELQYPVWVKTNGDFAIDYEAEPWKDREKTWCRHCEDNTGAKRLRT